MQVSLKTGDSIAISINALHNKKSLITGMVIGLFSTLHNVYYRTRPFYSELINAYITGFMGNCYANGMSDILNFKA